MDDLRFIQYVAYLAASVLLTLWVGQSLHRNGRPFLVDVMNNTALADSVNHLLLVGFYLVNLGVAALLINTGGSVGSPADVVQTLATRLGLVLLVLGGMHFGNLIVLSSLRRSAQARAYSQKYWSQVAATGQAETSKT
jgi:hypothetical protein